MSALTQRLLFNPTDADLSANVGSYIRAGSDGDLIASQSIAAEEWLNVAAALHDGAGNVINSTGGSLDVNITAAPGLGIYDEDSAHSSGDKGQFVFGLRVDDLSAVPAGVLAGTEGDYQGLISGPNGELLVGAVDFDIRNLSQATDSVDAWLSDGSGNAITSSGGVLNVNVASGDIDDDLADTAIENTATAVSTTAINIVSSALSGRKHLFLANKGNKDLYFGKTGVTTANGFPLYPGEKMAVRVGPSVTPQIIGGTGASSEDLRVMELA